MLVVVVVVVGVTRIEPGRVKSRHASQHPSFLLPSKVETTTATLSRLRVLLSREKEIFYYVKKHFIEIEISPPV